MFFHPRIICLQQQQGRLAILRFEPDSLEVFPWLDHDPPGDNDSNPAREPARIKYHGNNT